MEHSIFNIDGLIEAKGIHNPQVRWNGWACPFFPLESVQTISDYFGSLNGYEYEDCLQGGIVRVLDGVPHWVHMEDTETMFPISPVSIDGTDYYDIGSNGWCWCDDVSDMCPKCGEDSSTWDKNGCSCWLCHTCNTTNPANVSMCSCGRVK